MRKPLYGWWLLGWLFLIISTVNAQLPEITPDEDTLIKQLAGEPYYLVTRDTRIPVDSVVAQHVVVKQATLRIAGTVEGNVVALDGDVLVDSTAVVTGNITAVNGWVTLQPGARVDGIIRETTWETVSEPIEPETETWLYVPHPVMPPPGFPKNRQFILRYNRVEGVFIGLQNLPTYPTHHPLQLLWHVGYGFASKSGQYLLGLQRQFPLSRSSFWNVGFQGYRQTAVRDDWRLSEVENSLVAFFFNEDYLDYYQKEGGSIFTSLVVSPYLLLRGEYAEERHRELPVVTDWAVWGRTKQFRPALALGDYARFYRLFRLQGVVQTRARYWRGQALPFLQLQFWWENAPANWMEAWAYQRLEAQAVLNLPLSWADRLRLRLRGGSASGALPPQRLFLLGGFSTLRGYAFNAFQGNRYLLANVEYQIANDLVDDLLFGLDADIVIFLDSGAAWWVDDERSLWQWEVDGVPFNTDVGIGIGDAGDGLRINIARPLNGGGSVVDNVRVNVRLTKAF